MLLAPMRRNVVLVAAIIVLGTLGAYVWRTERRILPASPPNHGGTSTQTYQSERFGISFIYPSRYHLSQEETGNGERMRHSIILMEDTEENRAVREGRSPGREGSVTITFDLYQNNLDQQTLRGWLTGSNQSNFKLSNGAYQSATVAGAPAIQYRWSGLYEGETVAFLHHDWIVAASVTFLTPEDTIRDDFRNILATIALR